MKTVLLIDGKNTAYRALYASRGTQKQYHPFVVWLRLASHWLEKFKPDSVHVFWDCPKNEVWRKKVLQEYKDHRDSMQHYDDEVQQIMRNMLLAARKCFEYMGVRQYYRKTQECDDLIYSACRLMTPLKSDQIKVIVISSDSDFIQLQWAMSHVVCFDPNKNKFFDPPQANPIFQKALIGDKADNIDGYRGIGPVKGKKIAEDFNVLREFLENNDGSKFKRNLALIDMSLNPARVNNEIYLAKNMYKPVEFNKDKLMKLSTELKLKGFVGEYPRVVVPFKNLT